ncbi:MAG: hypothetical protein WCF77_04220, partial [Minisyncoccia bacterium]
SSANVQLQLSNGGGNGPAGGVSISGVTAETPTLNATVSATSSAVPSLPTVSSMADDPADDSVAACQP